MGEHVVQVLPVVTVGQIVQVLTVVPDGHVGRQLDIAPWWGDWIHKDMTYSTSACNSNLHNF